MNQVVIKANEKEEDFDKSKLNASLLKAGAGSELSASVTEEVDSQFKNCMNTDDVYNLALDHIKKSNPAVGLKYTLKRAVMSLGPAGFIFEKYAAKVLEQNGYRTEMPQMLSGFCVDHEVDIIANKEDEHLMVECKYHNISGNQSDIKTALYINSRFLDLKKGWDNRNIDKDINNRNSGKDIDNSNQGKYIENRNIDKDIENDDNKPDNVYFFTGAWLFTNTKCTSEAIKYANCSGMKVTAWGYPETESLQFYIESKKLYPVTILSTLSKNHKNRLFEHDVLTVKELIAYRIEDIVELLSINYDYADKILNEISLLLS